MKHEKEINQLLIDLFYDEWMSESDYNNLKESKTSKEQLSKDIETGISNGHSVESQLKLVKLMFNMIV